MILNHVNIVNVKKGKIIQNQTIEISGDRIKSINSTVLKSKNNQKIINLKNNFVLPGLIDLHVHVAEEPEAELAKKFHYNESEAKAISRLKRNLKKALSSGVTSLRDVGSYAGRGLLARKLVATGKIIGPRVFTCGHSLTTPKGHWFERSRQVPDSPGAIAQAVKEEIQSGADFIKIMIENPVFFSKKTIKKAVETTHKFNKKISAHAAFPKSIKLAIECSVDTLEHAGEIPPSLLQQVVRKKMTIIPTFYSAFISVKDPVGSLLYDTDASIPGSNQAIFRLFLKWLKMLQIGLPKLFKTNIKIGAGTDAGFPLVPYNSVIAEIQMLNQLGLSKLRCLQAATLIAAEVLGIKKLGSIEIDNLADLIVTEKNPLEDLDTLNQVKLVIKNGTIYKNIL